MVALWSILLPGAAPEDAPVIWFVPTIIKGNECPVFPNLYIENAIVVANKWWLNVVILLYLTNSTIKSNISNKVCDNKKLLADMVYKAPIDDFKYNLEMLEYDSVVSNIEKFKDYDIAAHVTLLKGERSQLATLGAEIL